MGNLKIGDNVCIGDEEPVFITAEIGQNHNGDVDLAKQLIDVSVTFGADAVKFCKRNVEKELTKNKLNEPYLSKHSYGNTYGEHRMVLELSHDQHKELASYAKNKGILYYSSVCDEDSVDLMEEIGVPLYKFASRDLHNLPLVEYVAKKNKPIIFSTGGSEIWEIEDTLNLVKKYHDKFMLMHTTSQYPTINENLNLNLIKTLKDKFKCLVGYSDHSEGIVAPVVATVLGAVAIEKHITISHSMSGSDHRGALEPDGLRRVVRDIRNLKFAFGNSEKKILEDELPFRMKMGKSIVTNGFIPVGTILNKEHFIIRSPGLGLTPKHLDSLIGKKVIKNLNEEHFISFEDIE